MMKGLWTAFEAAAATGGVLCARGGDPDRWIAEEWFATGVSIDAGAVKTGDLFVSLGSGDDSPEIQTAIARGASAVLAAHAPQNLPDGAPLLLVGDAQQGLAALARSARRRNFGKRIVVLGADRDAISRQMGETLAQLGCASMGGDIGGCDVALLLSLARMPMDADFAIFDAPDLDAISWPLVAPHILVIGAVPANGDVNVASAKAIDSMARGGCVVAPADTSEFYTLRRFADAREVRAISFGESPSADIRDLSCKTDAGAYHLAISIFGERIEIARSAVEARGMSGILSTLAAAAALGFSPADSVAAISGRIAPAQHCADARLTIRPGVTVTLIEEASGEGPASVAATIRRLARTNPAPGGRRIAVFGEMAERGAERPAFQTRLAGRLMAAKVDALYVAGPVMDRLWETAPAAMRAGKAPTAAALAGELVASLKNGDIVMVKGSNASKVSEIAAALRAAAT